MSVLILAFIVVLFAGVAEKPEFEDYLNNLEE